MYSTAWMDIIVACYVLWPIMYMFVFSIFNALNVEWYAYQEVWLMEL